MFCQSTLPRSPEIATGLDAALIAMTTAYQDLRFEQTNEIEDVSQWIGTLSIQLTPGCWVSD